MEVMDVPFSHLHRDQAGSWMGHARVWPAFLAVLAGLFAPALPFSAAAQGASTASGMGAQERRTACLCCAA